MNVLCELSPSSPQLLIMPMSTNIVPRCFRCGFGAGLSFASASEYPGGGGGVPRCFRCGFATGLSLASASGYPGGGGGGFSAQPRRKHHITRIAPPTKTTAIAAPRMAPVAPPAFAVCASASAGGTPSPSFGCGIGGLVKGLGMFGGGPSGCDVGGLAGLGMLGGGLVMKTVFMVAVVTAAMGHTSSALAAAGSAAQRSASDATAVAAASFVA